MNRTSCSTACAQRTYVRPRVGVVLGLFGLLVATVLSPVALGPAPTAGASPTAINATVTTRGDTLALEVIGTTVRVKGKAGETRLDLVGLRKDDKRKYAQAGKPYGEVKLDSDGFKLRDSRSVTRWKIKDDGDKIKVLAGETTLRYVLKKKGDDRWEVRRGEETEIGRVSRSQNGNVKVKDAKGAEVASVDGPFAAAYGIVLMPDVPPTDRAILIAEMLGRAAR